MSHTAHDRNSHECVLLAGYHEKGSLFFDRRKGWIAGGGEKVREDSSAGYEGEHHLAWPGYGFVGRHG